MPHVDCLGWSQQTTLAFWINVVLVLPKKSPVPPFVCVTIKLYIKYS